MELQFAPDVNFTIKKILNSLSFPHIVYSKLISFRSYGSKSRARARIWSFPKIWQKALGIGPHYIIEVLSEKYDKLKPDDQTRVIIHELMHIPKNFSGALLPHRGRGKNKIDARSVELLFQKFN